MKTKTTKRTSGPWELRDGLRGTRIESAADDMLPSFIAEMKIHRPGSGDRVPFADEQQANAALIAAAPELLAACEMAARHYADKNVRCLCEQLPTQCKLCAVKSAIAKAKGESK